MPAELAIIPAPLPAALFDPALPAMWDSIADRAEALRRQSKSPNTRKAYSSDWRQFTAWCMFSGVSALPSAPVVVAGYISHLSMSDTPRGVKFSTATIARRVASISHFHREAGLADPTTDQRVKDILAGVRRENATRPSHAKAALCTRALKRGLGRAEPTKPAGYRDRALALIGFAGAFRRSELVGIDVEHCTFDEENRLQIRLLRSKTNQEGAPESVWILPGGDCCPVRALKKWLEVSGITSGAVFRGIDRHGNLKGRVSGKLVSYAVKRTARRAGLDARKYSGHSLRSGHVTTAIAADVPLATIQQQTRHRSLQTLLSYNKHLEPMKRNSSASLGL